MKDAVSVVRCDSYREAEASVSKALSLIGGMEGFIKKGDRVLIKPNFIARKKPSDAITTHPSIIKAVIREVERAGGIPIIAESPGGVYSEGILKGLYATCGAIEAAEGTSAVLNYDTAFSEVSYPEGRTVKSFPVIQPVIDCDAIITLPKLKTHAMTDYTGAVKNLFGVIPGTYKAELHFRLNDKKAFCSMLLDLCEFVKPTLAIMDAVWGMEGNGPTSGTNRHVGLVMASPSPYAVDLACTHLIGYQTHEVETVAQAAKRGLCTDDISKLDIRGDELLVIPDYKKPDSHFDLLHVVPLPAQLKAGLNNLLGAKPQVEPSECIGCGECCECCPPKAIVMENKRPVINKKACIRCFCCQELCPVHAMKIKRSVINKIMLKFS